jgi:hypothetical protein
VIDDDAVGQHRVPPVTAERSPPDSRMTGADSPVIADSSTEAMPSMTSPSPGMISPASTTTSRLAAGRGDLRLGPRASGPALGAGLPGCDPARGGLGLGLAQRGRLRLAAALGHRLGQVGEQHGQPQPVQLDARVELA